MDTTAFWLPIIGVACFGFGILVGYWLAGGDLPAPEELEQEPDEQPQWERDFDHIMENAWKKKGWER